MTLKRPGRILDEWRAWWLELQLAFDGDSAYLSDASIQKNSSEIKLFDNPFAWSKVASVIYVSQPKGVGFSYCDIPADKECINNDLTSAQDF